MTVKGLAQELLSLKDELQDKEVVVKAENGMLVRPTIKFETIDKGNLEKTKDNVKVVILDWE